MTILEVIATNVAFIVAFITFIELVAGQAEKSIKPKKIKKLSNILKNYQLSPTFQHAFFSFNLFTSAIFGEKIISLRSFFSSILLSIFWVILIIIACLTLFPEFKSWFIDPAFKKLILNSFLHLIPFVLILDYLSIITTRLIIKKSSINDKGFIAYLLIILLDMAASIMIFLVGFIAIKTIFYNHPYHDISTHLSSIKLWVHIDHVYSLMQPLENLYKLDNGNFATQSGNGWQTQLTYALPEGVLFYSSILTSIWLWIHTLGYFIYKSSMKLDFIKKRWLKILDLNNNPVRAIAFSTTIILIILSGLFIIIFSTFKILF